jgi:hypothetical protein
MRVAKDPGGVVVLTTMNMRGGSDGETCSWRIATQQLPGRDNFGADIMHPILDPLSGEHGRPLARQALGKGERLAVEIVQTLEREGMKLISSRDVRMRWRLDGHPGANNVTRCVDGAAGKGVLCQAVGGWLSSRPIDDE